MNRIAVISFLATLLAAPAAADTAGACARYTLRELSPGMTHKQVRHRMRWDGVRTVIRTPQGTETSAIDFPEKTSDVYVEFDRRVDRRGDARAVLVRASIPWKEGTADVLRAKFGAPRDGAEALAAGLEAGASALWVDEKCGVVLTAYRPRGSWWAAEGGTALQVESLDRVRKGRSPASAQLQALLARPPAPTPPETPPETIMAQALPQPPSPEPPPPIPDVQSPAAAPPPMKEPVVEDPAPVPDDDPDIEPEAEAEVDAPVEQPQPQPQPRPTPPPPAPAPAPTKPAVAKSVKAWSPPRASVNTPPVDVRPTPPTAPQTIKSWRAEAGSAKNPAGAPPREPLTLRAWEPRETPAARISVVPPAYPAEARWLKLKGHVTLAIVVLPDGTVAERPRVLAAHPAGRGFEESAVEAVRRWRYSPAVREGKPVASNVTVGIDFK